MGTDKGKDLRRHERIEMPIVAEFKVKAVENQEAVSDKQGWTVLDDLGTGGIFFECDQGLEVSSHVNLKIGISISKDITCAGKIVRVVNEPDSKLQGVAIEFTDISKAGKELIGKFAGKSCK